MTSLLLLLASILLPAENSNTCLAFSSTGTWHQSKSLPLRSTFSTASSSSSCHQPLLEAINQIPIISASSTESCRIFHGRGGRYPGCEHLTLDWFPPVWVLTNFRETTLNNDELELIGNTLAYRWEAAAPTTDDDDAGSSNATNTSAAPLTWVYQHRHGNGVLTSVMAGDIPDPHIVTENSNKYWVQTAPGNANENSSSGQRHRGLFLDMANGRKWLQDNAEGKFILNLFSYTCAFSVAALNGGAEEVVNIDKVKGVIKIGQRNHDLNNLGGEGAARFMSHDIFKSWGKLRKLGPYDIIVADPPSYQKGSFVAKKDYGKLIRRLSDMLCEDGQVLLCLNAPELDTQFLKDLVSREAPELQFVRRLKNPDTFPDTNPDRALKVLLYKLKPMSPSS